MDFSKLNTVTDEISNSLQTNEAIISTVSKVLNDLSYKDHVIVEIPHNVAFDDFKKVATEYIYEHWDKSSSAGDLNLEIVPMGDRVMIRNKRTSDAGSSRKYDSVISDGKRNVYQWIKKIKADGHEVVNEKGLNELVFQDDILQGDNPYKNINEFIGSEVNGGKSEAGLYVIELPNCDFYSLEQFVAKKNYFDDVEEENIDDSITDSVPKGFWLYPIKKDGTRYAKPTFYRNYGHLQTAEEEIARLEKLNPGAHWEVADSSIDDLLKEVEQTEKDALDDVEKTLKEVDDSTMVGAEPDNLDDWIDECLDHADDDDTIFTCYYHGLFVSLEFEDGAWELYIDGDKIHDWDSTDEYMNEHVDDSKISDVYKDDKHGCYIYSIKKDGTRYAKPSFIRYIGSEKTPADVVKRLEKYNPNSKFVPANISDTQGEVSFDNITNDTIFVLCNGHVSKRFNSIENAKKWIDSSSNPSQFSLAKRENGVLTEI